MMNPGTGNGSGTSWLFSGPNSGGGFHTPDHLHGVQPPPTSSATFTPTSAFDDTRNPGVGPPGGPMIPFSQTDLNFVDSLTLHPSHQKTQQQQQHQQQQTHFVTSSTLHPSSLSVVEATSEYQFEKFLYQFEKFFF